MIHGPIIVEKAKKLQTQCNDVLPEEKKLTLNFSAGLLLIFQRHWNLQSFRTHEKGGDADVNVIHQVLPELKQKLWQFALRNVKNRKTAL